MKHTSTAKETSMADLIEALTQSLPESRKTYERNHAVLAHELVDLLPPVPVLREGGEGLARDRHGRESL